VVLSGAACLTHDPRYWDTTTRRGVTTRRGSVRIGGERIPRVTQFAYAKAVCATCPVIATCLSLGETEQEGIWGGTLPEERLIT